MEIIENKSGKRVYNKPEIKSEKTELSVLAHCGGNCVSDLSGNTTLLSIANTAISMHESVS